jgi:hypothetical protein
MTIFWSRVSVSAIRLISALFMCAILSFYIQKTSFFSLFGTGTRFIIIADEIVFLCVPHYVTEFVLLIFREEKKMRTIALSLISALLIVTFISISTAESEKVKYSTTVKTMDSHLLMAGDSTQK